MRLYRREDFLSPLGVKPLEARYIKHIFRKMIKVPPQIMTSYNRIANEWPVYTLIDAMVKFMLTFF